MDWRKVLECKFPQLWPLARFLMMLIIPILFALILALDGCSTGHKHPIPLKKNTYNQYMYHDINGNECYTQDPFMAHELEIANNLKAKKRYNKIQKKYNAKGWANGL